MHTQTKRVKHLEINNKKSILCILVIAFHLFHIYTPELNIQHSYTQHVIQGSDEVTCSYSFDGTILHASVQKTGLDCCS